MPPQFVPEGGLGVRVERQGGGGGACPLPTQTVPRWVGRLVEGDGCSECCPNPQPAPTPGPPVAAVIDPCADQGTPSECVEGATALTRSGTTAASGSSPITLSYAVALSDLPPNVRILRARATYSCTASEPWSVTDDGGGVTGTVVGGKYIEWGGAGLANLKRSVSGVDASLSVTAVVTFSSPPFASAAVTEFRVYWCRVTAP